MFTNTRTSKYAKCGWIRNKIILIKPACRALDTKIYQLGFPKAKLGQPLAGVSEGTATEFGFGEMG